MPAMSGLTDVETEELASGDLPCIQPPVAVQRITDKERRRGGTICLENAELLQEAPGFLP